MTKKWEEELKKIMLDKFDEIIDEEAPKQETGSPERKLALSIGTHIIVHSIPEILKLQDKHLSRAVAKERTKLQNSHKKKIDLAEERGEREGIEAATENYKKNIIPAIRTQLLAYCKKEIDELKLKHAEEMQFMQTNQKLRVVPKKRKGL